MSIYNKFLNRFHPRGLWLSLSKKNKEVFKDSKLILSFDCDTKEDFKVGLDVHTRLLNMNVMPVYAVPGELLIQGQEVYKKIHATGSEFINHGGRVHTYFDAKLDRYASNFFYDKQEQKVLREDIMLGHKILQDTLGVNAEGWRTPHFGTFQQPKNLKFMYSVLKVLNYKFSTSTVPSWGYKCGSLFKTNEIVEIPVTGVMDAPENIMDTWAYFEAPDRTKSPQDYLVTCLQLAEFASKNPVLINIYGDPSHIFDKNEFFEGIKILSQVAKNTNYSQLLGQLDGKIRSFQ